MKKQQTWQQWARACIADPSSPSKLFKGCLGALTGQDARALNAIVGCWELYSNSDALGQTYALLAARALILAMQPGTWWIARELIPFAMNWDDRDTLWPRCAPPPDPDFRDFTV